MKPVKKIKPKRKDYFLLRSKMIEYGVNQKDLGRILGVNKITANKKLNKKIQFTRDDISRIKDFFNLTPEEVVDIFFA